jgi:general secretion pathway protein A
MYNAHWGLTDQPFENTPDPRFLYRSAQYNEAYVRILYVIQEHKGAGMLTGIFGCGKTLVSGITRFTLRTLDSLMWSFYD